MQSHLDVRAIRQAYFSLFYELKGTMQFKQDVISMGNLALFVDHEFVRSKWAIHQKKIQGYLAGRKKNELYFYLAEQLLRISRDRDLSDNLDFKMKKIHEAYELENLQHFDLVLDPYEFPVWYKRVLKYVPLVTESDIHDALIQAFPDDLRETMVSRAFDLNLTYWIYQFMDEPEWFRLVAQIDAWILEENWNDLFWFLASENFRAYYPELSREERLQERDTSLITLKMYQQQHQSRQLKTCDILSERTKSEMQRLLK